MAYTHSKYEVQMVPQSGGVTTAVATNFSATFSRTGTLMSSTGIVGEWAPGMVPHIVRGIGVIRTNGNAADDGAWNVRFTHHKGTTGTATNLANVVYPTTVTSVGQCVYYIPSGSPEILPGEGIRANVTAAPTYGVEAKIMLYVEPRWETPANVTRGMNLTTGKPSD